MKIQITLNEDVEKYVREQSKYLGLSISGLCNMAIAQYKQQNEMINNMPKMMDLLGTALKMKQLEDKK